MDASSFPDTPTLVDLLAGLVRVYRHLGERVDPGLSGTARFLRSGNAGEAKDRLLEEACEALSAAADRHGHGAAKKGLAGRILGERGLDPRGADLLLELSQIGYWVLVYGLLEGEALEPEALAAALEEGVASTASAAALAQDLRRRPTAAAALRLIGRLSADWGLPPALFAELDLAEMKGRSYLRELFDEP